MSSADCSLLHALYCAVGYKAMLECKLGLNVLSGLMQERNKNGMELIPSDGNDFEKGKAKDTDQINVVYIVDSDKLPFYRAEQYHQFHNGIGKPFSKEYTVDLKRALASNGRIGPTGCPELRF